jgi:hypothetical protein
MLNNDAGNFRQHFRTFERGVRIGDVVIGHRFALVLSRRDNIADTGIGLPIECCTLVWVLAVTQVAVLAQWHG